LRIAPDAADGGDFRVGPGVTSDQVRSRVGVEKRIAQLQRRTIETSQRASRHTGGVFVGLACVRGAVSTQPATSADNGTGLLRSEQGTAGFDGPESYRAK